MFQQFTPWPSSTRLQVTRYFKLHKHFEERMILIPPGLTNNSAGMDEKEEEKWFLSGQIDGEIYL